MNAVMFVAGGLIGGAVGAIVCWFFVAAAYIADIEELRREMHE